MFICLQRIMHTMAVEERIWYNHWICRPSVDFLSAYWVNTTGVAGFKLGKNIHVSPKDESEQRLDHPDCSIFIPCEKFGWHFKSPLLFIQSK